MAWSLGLSLSTNESIFCTSFFHLKDNLSFHLVSRILRLKSAENIRLPILWVKLWLSLNLYSRFFTVLLGVSSPLAILKGLNFFKKANCFFFNFFWVFWHKKLHLQKLCPIFGVQFKPHLSFILVKFNFDKFTLTYLNNHTVFKN